MERKYLLFYCPAYGLENGKAVLIGKRRMGLVRYVMSLMNGARLGIACQALGIAQAAYNEALKYAEDREQFKRKIVDIPLVYEMLVKMKTKIEAARVLVYETSLIVDKKKAYDLKIENGENVDLEIKKQAKYYGALSSILTPMAKYYAAEIANEVANDALQIHGGTGYMREFNIERHFRDARGGMVAVGTNEIMRLVIQREIYNEFSKE